VTPRFGQRARAMVKVGGSAVFLVVLATVADLELILRHVGNVRPGFYALVFGITLANQFISTVRWQILLRCQGIRIDLRSLYRIYLLGFASNLVLPSSIGGDGVKIVKVAARAPDDRTGGAVATAMDRVTGLVGLVVVLLVTSTVDSVISTATKALTVAFCLSVLGVLAALYVRRGTGLDRVTLATAGLVGARDLVDGILSALDTYRDDRRAIGTAVALSVLFQAISAVNQYLTFLLVGVSLPLPHAMFAVGVTWLVLIVPVSIGGVGLKEVSLVALLAQVGVTPPEVVAYSVVAYSMILLVGVLFSVGTALESLRGVIRNT